MTMHHAPPLPLRFLQRALALLDRLEHAVGRHRQVVEADADGVGDGRW